MRTYSPGLNTLPPVLICTISSSLLLLFPYLRTYFMDSPLLCEMEISHHTCRTFRVSMRQ